MGIKIPFTNNYDTWRIATPRDPEAYQLDDNAHKLAVVGDLPDGYVWTMYISVMGKYKDALLLTRDATGVSTTLTAENLAYGDVKYSMQLVGVKGDVTRKTNEISVYIPKSLIDGDTDWPDRVGAFEEAQTAVLGALTKTPYIDETTGTWFVWSATAGTFVDSGVAAEGPQGNVGPAGAPGTTLGWDVEDDGEGNVTMTYPDGEYEDSNAVRFTQQTLTVAQQSQARTNIGAAAADANYSVRYNAAQVLEATQKAQARQNIGAASASLETLSENQASNENVLELAARAISTVASDEHMSFSLNDDGTFSIFGANGHASNNAIFYTSAAAIASASALKPPAGVYRLEISADQAADFTAVWGVLYIENKDQFVVTDAVGKSVEIYLDGNTPVSSGIVVGPGKNANGLKLTIALRRIGTPELGELLVDQINQMQALQRKALGMLDSIAGAYKYRNDMPALSRLVNSGLYPTKTVASVVASKDLNDIPFDSGSNYSVRLLRFNEETLHTPYAEGITSQKYGVVLDYHSGTNTGIQFALPVGSSDEIVCVRKLSSGTWGSWLAIGGAASGT